MKVGNLVMAYTMQGLIYGIILDLDPDCDGTPYTQILWWDNGEIIDAVWYNDDFEVVDD